MIDFFNLTIVFFTYNKRMKWVLRNCDYWKNSSVRIVILDGSVDPFIQSTEDIFPSNVRYVHCPRKTYIERIKISLGHIDTKYVLMNNDDDVKFKSVVGRCIDELERDVELVACNGVYSYFSYWHNEIYALPEVSFYNSGCQGDCLRTERLLRATKTLFMDGVFRFEVYQSCVKALFEVPSPSHLAFTFQFVAAYHGRWKQLDELMWMRSYESPAAASLHGINRSLLLFMWVDELDNQEDVNDWITIVVNSLSRDIGDNPMQIKEAFLKALNSWCEAEKLQKREEDAVSDLVPNWRRKTRLLLPHWFLRIYQSLRYRKPAGVPIQIQLKWLQDQGVSVDSENISDLSSILKQHSSK
jgi:glycosyltransferase domain-containing protein